jgi:uncharacterized protein with HEPN domain
MKYSPEGCLRDMLTESRFARQFVGEKSYEEFLNDPLTTRAVVRSLEIVGEACRRLPREFRSKHPQVPGSEIAGMRDRLIHDYTGINYRLVWAPSARKCRRWRTN